MGNAKKILLIDDDNDILEVNGTVLEAAGYTVAKAASAEAGIKKVAEVVPDLIILDVMMENETSGFHVAYKLKNPGAGAGNVDFKKIPILMITSIGQKTGMKLDPATDGDYLPVEAFLEKPVDPDRLIKKVKEMIG